MTSRIVNSIFFVIFCLVIYYLLQYYYKYIEYYSQIKNYAKIKDFTRWVLTDKFIAKEYAKLNGFKTAETYQLVKYPQHINFDKLQNKKGYVIKPVDLCDSGGIYLIKNNINIKTGETMNKDNVKNELLQLRSKIFDEYYMHEQMYNGLIPFTGYIIEELLLDENNNIPNDYKCYVFGGKIYYIAMTYNRVKHKSGEQTFDCLWFNRDWVPIKNNMLKKGYKYSKDINKPKGYEKMLYLVEKIGKKMDRHCRIDVYLINGEVYLGEFTFFCGALLHTFYCNYNLGLIWLKNKDNYEKHDKTLYNLVPDFYNKPYLK